MTQWQWKHRVRLYFKHAEKRELNELARPLQRASVEGFYPSEQCEPCWWWRKAFANGNNLHYACNYEATRATSISWVHSFKRNKNLRLPPSSRFTLRYRADAFPIYFADSALVTLTCDFCTAIAIRLCFKRRSTSTNRRIISPLGKRFLSLPSSFHVSKCILMACAYIMYIQDWENLFKLRT